MPDHSPEELLALLAESERVPEIVRDDAFWRGLEEMSEEEIRSAIGERFMRSLPPDDPPELIRAWAAHAACVAEMVARYGAAETRQRLREKPH